MPPFVLLNYAVGPLWSRRNDAKAVAGAGGDHFDWMFQYDNTLKTWATAPIVSLRGEVSLDARRLPDHRLEYLEIEGDIGNDRGSVSQVIRGDYQLAEFTDETFRATLCWRDCEQVAHQLSLELYRSADDFWRLCLSECR
ncbi:MAG: hypothetical protein HKN47_20370 [Pirellulaceae bacterium]|nr:hypothetical protein [Pirellulaceae bacterium]